MLKLHVCAPRLSGVACLLLAVSAGMSAPSALRSGWVYVPGGQDLIQNGQWCSTFNQLLSVGTSSLTISATGAYNTVINSRGPHLQVQGDFSVLATLSPQSSSPTLTLVGSLSNGGDWWNGLKRVDVGVVNGRLSVGYWTGSSSNAIGLSYPLPAGTTDPINLETARIGNQIVVFVNGLQAGSLTDPGLFSSENVYLGFNVAPQTTLSVLALAAAIPGGSTAALVAAPPIATRTVPALRDMTQPTGVLIGAWAHPYSFWDPQRTQALGSDFNLTVALIGIQIVEPSPHQFNFCWADETLAYAQANGMKVRGTPLVWSEQLPSWLTDGNYSSAEAAAILLEYINAVVGRYKGQIIEWDVVNEASHTPPSPAAWRPSYWYNQLGGNYMDLAFRWAHAADPNAKLYFNDTGGEGLGGRSDAIYGMVKGLVDRGVPIDGVGLEMHETVDSAPSQADLSSNLARLGALGLQTRITEMEVGVKTDASGNASAADLSAQAKVYKSVLDACLVNANCMGLVTYPLADVDSWIGNAVPGYGASALLDSQYRAKPAYTAVADELVAMSKSGPPAIYANGVVIHGGTAAVVSPGALVDVYGTTLAPATATASGLPLLTSLGGVQVTVNGAAAPVYYVSTGQLVFQIPYSVSPGPALVAVISNGLLSRAAEITVQQAAPSILTYGNSRAVAQNQDYSLNSPTDCASPGTYLTAYLIGSGPLDNLIATGAAAPMTPLSAETLTTTATLGGAPAPVAFAGMTPGLVGLMQVNIQVPKVSGDVSLQISVGTYSSNQALVCVGNP